MLVKGATGVQATYLEDHVFLTVFPQGKLSETPDFVLKQVADKASWVVFANCWCLCVVPVSLLCRWNVSAHVMAGETAQSDPACVEGNTSLIARFMGSTRGPSGANRTQVGPMLAPLALLSGFLVWCSEVTCVWSWEFCVIKHWNLFARILLAKY